MRITLTLDTGTAAFGSGAQEQAEHVAWILRREAGIIDKYGRVLERKVSDLNGNTVGAISIEKEA